MPGVSATVTSKGQVTIPKEVRVRLGITTGDRLDFEVLPNGTLTAKRQRQGALADVLGILKRPGQRAVSVEEMNEAITGFHAKAEGRPRTPRPQVRR